MKICCAGQSKDNQLQKTADFLKIIAEENRLKILCILINSGEQCVYDIWQYLNLAQNLTSHHLKVLKDAGLITSRKEGLNVFYSINKTPLNKSLKLLEAFLTSKKKTC